MAQIDPGELVFTYARSSGPGGQNVNRVQTRAMLQFDVTASPSLSDYQKRRIFMRLAGRIKKEGVLRVISQRHRTQEANRRAAIERFHELIEEALHVQRPRRKTRVSRGAKRRRMDSKRRRGDLKRTRSDRGDRD